MKKYIFTDLACEKIEKSTTKTEDIRAGIKKAVSDIDAAHGTGRYITFYTPKLWLLDDAAFFFLKREIAVELRRLLSKNACRKGIRSVLVVGLGNPYLTSDALGAETVKGIAVTHHSTEARGVCKVFAIIPDVSGNTGIDTVDTVRAYINAVSPDAVVAVDAMRARSYERLASTVQLSETGITPGGGVNSKNPALCHESLGVPVISLGVPTVVNSSTMICEVLSKYGSGAESEELRAVLNNGLNFFVAPTEADALTKAASLLLSSAINEALSSQAF